MHVVFFIGPLCAFLFACSPSEPTAHYVLDTEGALDPRMGTRLDSLFRSHEDRTGNEIALVTHATFHGRSAKDFAISFGDSTGVGKKVRDNGVTIAFSKARREVFIATGHGTAKVLHDSICQRIIDREMLPRFKLGDTNSGLWYGCIGIVEFLERPKNRIP
ncbi:MAG: TPM domain-containing protein [Flavobacteriales bacterium]|nr:TPM domain-containing protein [Flavobacteriales bacterium]